MAGKGKFTWLVAAGLAAGWGLRRWSRQRRKIDFNEKVVVITGGSRGLGLVMARQFAAEGAHIVLLARDKDELERASLDLQGYRGRGLTMACDVTQADQVEEVMRRIVEHFGRVDILLNNAGTIQVGPLNEMTEADYQQAMNVHFWGPFYTTRAVVPYMRQQGGGRIINISSIGGAVAVPHLLPYTASKFALTGFSDGIRAELAQDNILVTTVIPGLMRTGSPINANFKGQNEKEFAWFSISDSLPLLSVDARRAAAQIKEACRYGDPVLIISLPARMAVFFNSLFPGLTALATKAASRVLPDPAQAGGEISRSGWESQSRWSPSVLTTFSDQAALRNNEAPPPFLDT